jgi:hypothetical protein
MEVVMKSDSLVKLDATVWTTGVRFLVEADIFVFTITSSQGCKAAGA